MRIRMLKTFCSEQGNFCAGEAHQASEELLTLLDSDRSVGMTYELLDGDVAEPDVAEPVVAEPVVDSDDEPM